MNISHSLIKVNSLKKYFPIHGGIFYKKIAQVHAVDDVSFEINPGETLGLVGESGCGKSTLGRTLLRLYEPDDGEIFFSGKKINDIKQKELRRLRKSMQIVFQDPMDSLNPRMTVGSILEEPFLIHKEVHNFRSYKSRQEKVKELLKAVGLQQNAFHKYPHEFSGGQRQRIGIARAIALSPQLVVCDEPVSALDVSVQSQILNLLVKLQEELDLTYLFIAHNLAVVKYISDRIAVMYLGKIVEITDAESIYNKPLHPYTRVLMSAIPEPDPKKRKQTTPLSGEVPSPINPPSGCYFHPRCPFAKEVCKERKPKLQPVNENEQHQVACHFAGSI